MSFRSKALAALTRHGQVVLVTVADTKGSTPREAGAQLLVTAQGFLGSIGGGTLEWQAMAQAQAMLAKGINHRTSDFILGPDLGQCCGGRVGLHLQRFDAAPALAQAIGEPVKRRLLLFGAGHVGRALVLVMAQSEFDVDWVDPRPNAFPQAVPTNVTIHNVEDVLAILVDVPEQSLVLVMSHSHELDFVVTDAALGNRAVAKIGLIGSATKRARFLSRLAAAGHGQARLADLLCPIGGGEINSKKPYAIAISTAAQLMALDETLRMPQTYQMAKVQQL